jgi:hypothetical protein
MLRRAPAAEGIERGAEWSRIDQNSFIRKLIVGMRRSIMPTQFENPQEKKVEEETVLGASTVKKISLVTEKAAEKSAKTEQKFDKENSSLFTR